MRFVSGWVLAIALVLASASSAITSTAFAQEDREAARAEFERGRSSFEAGAFREALDHFQEAYRLAPHPNVRVNIANCYDQLDRPIEALFHFEHFLTEAGNPPAAQRREVETAMARLRQRVGTLTLQITPDGAQITIDSTETRRAPVAEPVRVVAGSHVVEIQLEGYRPERQTVVVEGGGTARLAIRLQRADPTVASTGTTGTAVTATTGTTSATVATTTGTTTTGTTGVTTTGTSTEPTTTSTEPTTTSTTTSEPIVVQEEPPTTDDGGGIRITTPTIIAASVTGAALVGAVIFGALALSANGSFEDAVLRANDGSLSEADRAQARADGEGAASDARTFAVVTDVMLITAAVGAGVTTALFIIAQGESDQEDTVSLLPVVAPSTAGVLATGRF